MEIHLFEAYFATGHRQGFGLVAVGDADRLRNGLQAILNHADVFEDAGHHPHDPAGHVDDADHQAGGQGDGPHADQRLRPQPQGQAGGADDQQAVHAGDDHVHAGDDTASQLRLFGLFLDRFAGVLLLEVGVGEQFQGGDVGVAVDNPPHEFGARIGRHHRAILDPWHEVTEGADEGEDPGQQRDHQVPVGFGEQHQGTDGVDQHMPQRIHGLHGGIAQ
ncbi:hypothetical protein D9M72_483740 [compost metagenome]